MNPHFPVSYKDKSLAIKANQSHESLSGWYLHLIYIHSEGQRTTNIQMQILFLLPLHKRQLFRYNCIGAFSRRIH